MARVTPQSSRAALAAALLATIGCALPDDASSHRCLVDDDCTAGRVCVAGVCANARPDADLTIDAPAPTIDVPAPNVDAPMASTPDAPTPAADGEVPDAGADRGEACDGCAPAASSPQIAAGDYMSCVRTADLRIVCWGAAYVQVPPRGVKVALSEHGPCVIRENGSIGCGFGDFGNRVPPAGAFTDLAIGDMLGCGVRADGRLGCWMYYDYPEPVYSIDLAPAGTYTEVAVNAPADTSLAAICALRTDRTIACWATDDEHLPPPPPGTFRHVAVATGQACGVRDDGALLCWGAVSLTDAGPFREVTVGGDRLCALTAAGDARCWERTGAALPEVTGPFTSLAAGAKHVCAVRPGGGVSCWGDNRFWQSGVPRGPFLSVDTVDHLGCAVKADHSLSCWGERGSPPLGPAPEGRFTAVQISDWYGYACAIRDNGSLACWGENPDMRPPPPGQFRKLALPCGLRTDGTVACWMNGMSDPAGTFLGLSAFGRHVCAVGTDHTITCWSGDDTSAPIPPTGAFEDVMLGDAVDSVCGLRADGSVSCTACQASGKQWVCGFPLPTTAVPRGPLTKVGFYDECMCGLNETGFLRCWSAFVSGDCPPFDAKGVKVIDFSSWCLISDRGALLCNGGATSVDLDAP
jgi:hypothetical protein